MAQSKSSLFQKVSVSRLRGVRVSPQKARLVVNTVRGVPVSHALNVLRFQKKKTARLAEKVIRSAVASAVDVRGADVDTLVVLEAFVDAGVTLKRSMPRARGRATPIHKRCSHITVVLGAPTE